MEPLKFKMAVAVVCFVHVFAVFLFLRGFFPMKSSIVDNNHSNRESYVRNNLGKRNASELYFPIVGKTVLLVIDALRADFLFGTAHVRNMPYLQELMSTSRRAMNFIAKVHSPTVTLPRIKALTSGTIPDFIDVVMNFGASECLEDNVIDQAFRNGHRIVFYGDETWIRLFPHQFHRSEGTASFFVNDFHEVDDNVTRHLESEMGLKDWSVLVLHYLGLDHIGHVFGPQSELVGPKLREMDHVIQLLDVALKASEVNETSKPSLLVICGDHGMNNAGGHGGSSLSETMVPLVFISSAFQGAGEGRLGLKEVRQIDVAPTLSALLALPIPRNNLGRLLPGLYDGLDWKRKLYLARLNAAQLQQMTSSAIDESCLKDFETADRKHAEWLTSKETSNDPTEIASLYNDTTVCFSDSVASRLTGYDDYAVVMAIVLLWLTQFYVVQTRIGHDIFCLLDIGCIRQFLVIFATFLTFHCLICQTTLCAAQSFLCDLSSVASIASVTFSIIFMSSFVVHFLTKRRQLTSVYGSVFNQMSLESWLLVAGCVLHALSLSSTSFIEEEHQTWYFLCGTFFLVSAFAADVDVSTKKSDRWLESVPMFASAVLLRAARSWNATGDKWAHLSDVGDFLNLPENKIWLSFVVIVGLSVILGMRVLVHHRRRPIAALLVTTLFVTYLYHTANGTLLPFLIPESRLIALSLARLNYGLVLLMTVLAGVTSNDTCDRFESVVTGWIAVCVLLLRPHNIPLLAFWTVTSELLSLRYSTKTPVVVYVWLAQAAFFQQGNANSLARIDLTSGYVGLRTYDPVLVGMLLIISTYAGPVFWLLSLFATVHRRNPRKRCDTGPRPISSSLLALLACRNLPWCFYTVVVYTQRYHLFVWTVFSPKLLFEGMLSLVYVMLILSDLALNR